MSANQTKSTPTTTATVYILVDENGDSAIGIDQPAALSAYDENIGRDDDAPLAMRWAKVTLTVPLPTVANLVGIVPAEGEAALTVA